ncbi:MAG: hypothetical protein J3K34DRAFT_441655 [Monoraphidium minutum]|nr:MAG: hypothetical protein J3K34DRAFT_441655 [Monoraphidium minutum]
MALLRSCASALSRLGVVSGAGHIGVTAVAKPAGVAARAAARRGASTAPGGAQAGGGNEFDEALLPYLVCPLSKTPLRFDRDAMELVNDDLGVAYPIVGGIPRLVPADGRMLAAPPGGGAAASSGVAGAGQ